MKEIIQTDQETATSSSAHAWIPLQWKNFLACEYSRLPTPQLTTRHSGPFAGEKTFLAKRDILYSQADKDSFVNQSSKLAEEELTCDSYKYINALHSKKSIFTNELM